MMQKRQNIPFSPLTAAEEPRGEISQIVSSDSESSITNGSQGKTYHMITGEKILLEMKNKLDNEEAYLHYFKQLVDLENFIQIECSLRDHNFQIKPYITFPVAKQSKIKNTKTPLFENVSQNKNQSSIKRKSFISFPAFIVCESFQCWNIIIS